ncbi:MAG: hypothetical protein R2874_02105 [Desulfobacterales bacterium]
MTLRILVSVASLCHGINGLDCARLLEEKIAGLIRALPKSYRKQLVPPWAPR